MRRPGLFPRVILTFVLLIVGIAYVYPFLWMVSSSLKTRSDLFAGSFNIIPPSAHWTNYVDAWREARLDRYFGNTLIVAVSSSVSTIAVTALAGFALSRGRFPGRRVFAVMILISVFLPRGYTIIPLVEVITRLRLMNTLLAVVLINVASGVAFNTFLFFSFFSSQSVEVEEAALLDGASYPRLFLALALPNARPVIGAVAIFEFIDNWNSFFVPLVFTFGRPDLQTLAVGIYSLIGQHSTEWPLLCAAATISVLPVLLIFTMLQKYFVDAIVGSINNR